MIFILPLLHINQKIVVKDCRDYASFHAIIVPLLIPQYISGVRYRILNNLRQVRACAHHPINFVALQSETLAVHS